MVNGIYIKAGLSA